MRWLCLVLPFLVACPSGSDELDETDGGGSDPMAPNTQACGRPVSPPEAPECEDFSRCRQGNVFTDDFNCELCPDQVNFSTCVAGTCVPFERQGRIVGELVAPLSTIGARSILVTQYDPVAADGTQLTCEGMLSTDCSELADRKLNPINSNLLSTGEGGINDAKPNFSFSIQASPGENRIIMVHITRASKGRGQVLATGCVEGISVGPNSDEPAFLGERIMVNTVQ